MVTKAWKVYGLNGHRQKESFNLSARYEFTEDRIIEVDNSDKTGTNEYSIIRITRETEDQTKRELEGQLSDGVFETCRVGKVVAI